MKKENHSDEVKTELIAFVKSIKKKTNIGIEKHLCDHLLWMIEDYDILEKAFLRTSLGKTFTSEYWKKFKTK